MSDDHDVLKEATRIASYKMTPMVTKISAKIGDYDIERTQPPVADDLNQIQAAPLTDPIRDTAQDATNFLGEFGVTVTKRE